MTRVDWHILHDHLLQALYVAQRNNTYPEWEQHKLIRSIEDAIWVHKGGMSRHERATKEVLRIMEATK